MPGRDGLANNPYSGQLNYIHTPYSGLCRYHSSFDQAHVSPSVGFIVAVFFFYPGEATKFGRNDSSSPAPPTSLSTAGVQSQPQQAPQAGTQGQSQGQSQGQQAQNQAFLNPPLPPGYGYTGEDPPVSIMMLSVVGSGFCSVESFT